MTAFLVDTHTLLWATGEPAKLSRRATQCLEDPGHRILVSHATIWELSIKLTIGKIRLPETFFADLTNLGYETLTLADEHFSVYRSLPLHHRDPFDRLLVAQALSENLTLVSCDPDLRKYGVELFW